MFFVPCCSYVFLYIVQLYKFTGVFFMFVYFLFLLFIVWNTAAFMAKNCFLYSLYLIYKMNYSNKV